MSAVCRACRRPTRRLVFLTFAQASGRLAAAEVGPYGRECAAQVRKGLRDLGIPYTSRHARA